MGPFFQIQMPVFPLVAHYIMCIKDIDKNDIKWYRGGHTFVSGRGGRILIGNEGNHALGLTFVPAWNKKVVSGAKKMNSTPPFVVLSGQTVPLQSV